MLTFSEIAVVLPRIVFLLVAYSFCPVLVLPILNMVLSNERSHDARTAEESNYVHLDCCRWGCYLHCRI